MSFMRRLSISKIGSQVLSLSFIYRARVTTSRCKPIVLIDAVNEYLVIWCGIKKMSVEVRVETFHLIEVHHISGK